MTTRARLDPLLFLLPFLLLCAAARADLAPGEARRPSWQPSTAAQDAVAHVGEGSLDAAGLARELRAIVAADDLAPGDRADAFELLQRRAGLAFVGAVKLPPRMGYVDVFERQAATYRELHDALGDTDADVDGLLDAVKRAHANDSIRSASALLLAAILDPPAAAPTVEALLDPGRLSRAQVPPLALHAAAHAVALIDDDTLSETLARLAVAVPLEESQEDALCGALAHPPAAGARETAIAFARDAAAAEDFTTAGHTALILLRRRLDPAAFATLLDELVAAAPGDARRTLLQTFRTAEPPRGGMAEPPAATPGDSPLLIKKWDGFHATLYDDGARLQWGDTFSDFLDY